MKSNVSTVDRIIRLLLAVVFAGLYFGNVVTGTVGIILVVLGAVFAVTAAISFCPIYAVFGLSTKPKK